MEIPGLLTRTSDFETDEYGVSIVFELYETCCKFPYDLKTFCCSLV